MRQPNLIYYSLIKYFNVGVGIIQGIFQVWVFTRYFSGSNLSYIFFLFGLLNYFSLFDLGLGRPIYASLRRTFLSKGLLSIEKELIQAVMMYIIIAIGVSILFVGVGIFSAIAFKVSISIVTVIWLCFSLSISINLVFLKDIFDSIDRFQWFEALDLLRRFTLLVGSILLIIEPSLFNLAFFQTISFSILYIVSLYLLIGSPVVFVRKLELTVILAGFHFYSGDMKNNLIFKVNEIAIYNWGYLLMPFISDKAVLIYSIWQRLFQGLTVPLRTFTDILIHPMTRMYHTENYNKLRKFYMYNLLLSLALAFSGLIILFRLREFISEYWLNGTLDIDLLFLGGLSLWVLSNMLQHSSGKILLSVGGRFDYFKKVSLIISVSTFIAISVSFLLLNGSTGVLILISGVIYFLGAITYMLKVRALWSLK